MIFPDNYVDLWCNYTQKEAFTIKNALRGSLVIGITEGFGKDYENYTSNFAAIAGQFTGDSTPYEMQRRFLQTAYVHDTVGVLAHALSELVEKRALQVGLPDSMLISPVKPKGFV